MPRRVALEVLPCTFEDLQRRMRTMNDTVRVDTSQLDEDAWLLTNDLCIVPQEHPGLYTERSIRYRLENQYYESGVPEALIRFKEDALRSAFLLDHPRVDEIYRLAAKLCPDSLGGIAAILEAIGRVIHG